VSYKDFDAWLNEQRGEVTFTVGGQTFTGRKRVGWQKMNRYLLNLGAEGTDGIEQTRDFFRMVLIPADRERFLAAVDYDGDDDDRILSAEQVGKILDWLLGVYTGKAQSDVEQSSAAQPGTGAQSNVVSLSPKAS
jgi:hypothetical protein